MGGITLYPFIFIKKGINGNKLKVLINHEKIHLRQQLELLIIPFYIIYLLNYLYLLAVHQEHKQAYRGIIFEKEAFNYENDFNYLKRRKFFGFLK